MFQPACMQVPARMRARAALTNVCYHVRPHSHQPAGQRRELSSALLNDSLRVFPVAPDHISNVECPIIKVHKVGAAGRQKGSASRHTWHRARETRFGQRRLARCPQVVMQWEEECRMGIWGHAEPAACMQSAAMRLLCAHGGVVQCMLGTVHSLCTTPFRAGARLLLTHLMDRDQPALAAGQRPRRGRPGDAGLPGLVR
jgi:hypothetical protein